MRQLPLRAFLILLVVVGCAGRAFAQTMPADYQQVLTLLGRTGDFKSGVLKVNIPRGDLHVTVAGVPTPTSFGFGGWVAMTKGTGGADVMDLIEAADRDLPRERRTTQ